MNLKEWRRLAIQSVTLLMAVVLCSICYSNRMQMDVEDKVLAESNGKKDTIEKETQTTQQKEPNEAKAEWSNQALQMPAEKEKKIVVIDAGHGGMDEGTASPDRKCIEKVYTLRVSKRLCKLLEEENIEVYTTRDNDKTVSKKARITLAKKKKADLLISIHCNASTFGDYTSCGMETLYSERKLKNAKITNKRLAKLLLDNMAASAKLEERKIIRREDLYLLHHSKVPTVIVELGYITNENDMKYIMKEKGQKELAQGICNGILEALEEMD